MIFTNSAFIFDIEITPETRFFPFNEFAGELNAELRPGRYTLTGVARELARAMNEAGNLDFTVSVDRATRRLTIGTIGGVDTFNILAGTGATVGASAFGVLGFGSSDTGFATSHTGTLAVGRIYLPQFRLQGFVDFKDNQRSVSGQVLESASGDVEVVRFGVYEVMECEIKFITDINQGADGPIRTDLDGVGSAREFMKYAITKGPIEFVPDVLDFDSFTPCLLERTPESGDGISFKLKEEFSQGLTGYYTTGLLEFRKIKD